MRSAGGYCFFTYNFSLSVCRFSACVPHGSSRITSLWVGSTRSPATGHGHPRPRPCYPQTPLDSPPQRPPRKCCLNPTPVPVVSLCFEFLYLCYACVSHCAAYRLDSVTSWVCLDHEARPVCHEAKSSINIRPTKVNLL